MIGTAASSSAGVEPVAASPLSITRDTPTSLAGQYLDSTSVVGFSATLTTPVTSTVTVRVNGTTLSARRDLAAGTGSWGAGGKALDPAAHAALVRTRDALNLRWATPARATGAPVGAKQDLLLRLVMLAAEAPVGVGLPDQAVNRPTERRLEKQGKTAAVVLSATATKEESCEADVVATTAARSVERSSALKACQQSNEDGILYFGSCATTGRYLCHDANTHCFLCETITAGPGSSDCMGECGPGCKGLNIYTYDCGDHDRCGRAHGGSTNPWDAECGDEYFEADDDFLWGWPNC